MTASKSYGILDEYPCCMPCRALRVAARATAIEGCSESNVSVACPTACVADRCVFKFTVASPSSTVEITATSAVPTASMSGLMCLSKKTCLPSVAACIAVSVPNSHPVTPPAPAAAAHATAAIPKVANAQPAQLSPITTDDIVPYAAPVLYTVAFSTAVMHSPGNIKLQHHLRIEFAG